MASRLRAAKHWLLLLDFDGTLAPIGREYQSAELHPAVRPILGKLAGRRRAEVYVISGRPLAYLRRMIDVPGVHLLGVHGWERSGVPAPARARHRLLRIKRRLERSIPRVPGIEIEDKGMALAIHYRSARPADVRSARQAMMAILERLQSRVRLLEGRKIWELLPPFIDGKGATARRLLAEHQNEWLVICAGDDASDEAAFGVIRGGVTIHVGSPADTRARFWLRDPDEVRLFLERLENLIA